MSARHASTFNRCLMLSLCLHSLFTLGILFYMAPVTLDLDHPTPVSVTLPAPIPAPLTPHLAQRSRRHRPPPVITQPQPAPQPTATPLAAVPSTAAHVSRPTLKGTSPPLPRRVPAKRRTPVKRLSVPVGKTVPAVPASQSAQTPPPVAATGSLDANRSGRPAARQMTGEALPRFVYQPKPHYPLVARRRGWQGTVMLNIEMLSDGTIGTIKIATSSGYPPLDAAARKAVRKWRHLPLQRNGIPITRQATLPIHFRLD